MWNSALLRNDSFSLDRRRQAWRAFWQVSNLTNRFELGSFKLRVPLYRESLPQVSDNTVFAVRRANANRVGARLNKLIYKRIPYA